jgi:NAD(P)-dependent dehydrogenase (short-subunit alcohol dehydrogenase family)
MLALANKIAIVTGASSGIGRATAKLFAEEGAKVIVAARRQAELDALVAEIADADGTAVALAGNVRDETYAKALVDLAVEKFGGLDIAFNNAGAVGLMGPISELPLEEWRETLDTNLTSAFLGEISGSGDDRARRWFADLHFHLRRQHRRHARHDQLCRQQGRADRADAGACR